VNYITQYDYSTGTLEVDISLNSETFAPYGLFEYGNEIYIADARTAVLTYIWKIDRNPPYNLTLHDELNILVNGASQIPYQLNVHFAT
jgi:hypothetical protein